MTGAKILHYPELKIPQRMNRRAGKPLSSALS
jgi:hypothetical protein